MAKYNFSQLSPYDFELMSRDLLQAEESIRLESFRIGRDGGVDFRYAPSNDPKSIIVQCKHYVVSGLVGLLRELKREAQKVTALRPSRYILVTSVPLTITDKDKIVKLFNIFLMSTGDIIGGDDLNNLLGKHPHIEKQHYKLWLASTAVLQTVLHNASTTRSNFEVERIHKKLRLYVSSATYPKALEILERDRVVIICGQPGIGKTTMSEMLLYQYLERGFAPIIVNGEIGEARDIYSPEKPQIVYYDDFLGATFLGENGSFLQRNEDRNILQFIEMVKSSKLSRLVLTTREHILHQAVAASERFARAGMDHLQCVLELRDYSLSQRAQILYNHIFFSDLPTDYRNKMLDNNFYLKILKHDNFNPRLVEWLSSYHRIKSETLENYQQFIVKLLDNPGEIWRHVYDHQISNEARSLLLALHSAGARSNFEKLENLFHRINNWRSQKYGFARSPNSWRKALREVTDALVTSTGHGLTFINPSVVDLMNTILVEEPENAIDVLHVVDDFRQFERVWTLAKSPGAENLKKHLAKNTEKIIEKLTDITQLPYRVKSSDGRTVFSQSYESRLATLLEFADASRSVSILEIANNLFEVLRKSGEAIEVIVSVRVLETIETADWNLVRDLEAMHQNLKALILDTRTSFVQSQGIQTLFEYSATSSWTATDSEDLESLCNGYLEKSFNRELADCTNSTECQEFRARIEHIGAVLSINVEEELKMIAELLRELDRDEELRAEAIGDEWKERHYENRQEESEIREMFGSLRLPD